MSSDIRFSLDYEDLHIEIHAILKKHDQEEAGYGHYELHFRSSKVDAETLTHYWPKANFPLEQEAFIESLEDALDEEGMIEHILECWSNLEKAQNHPRWANKSFKKL